MERIVVLVVEGVLELLKELTSGDREEITIEDITEAVAEKFEDYSITEEKVAQLLDGI